MLEELFESEFFILSHKINKIMDKKKLESFVKSLFGINSILHHNLFVVDLIEGKLKSFGSPNVNKNLEFNRNFILIDQKKVLLRNIDYPFLGLPFQVKTISDKFPIVWKIFDSSDGIDWVFSGYHMKIFENKLNFQKKKKVSHQKIRFLIFNKMIRTSGFSTRKKTFTLAFRNFI